MCERSMSGFELSHRKFAFMTNWEGLWSAEYSTLLKLKRMAYAAYLDAFEAKLKNKGKVLIPKVGILHIIVEQ